MHYECMINQTAAAMYQLIFVYQMPLQFKLQISFATCWKSIWLNTFLCSVLLATKKAAWMFQNL